ncbi:MAG: LacI family transcriptional regulator [Lentisphaerae bacterium]|nr:MAG: LacI family transcriptional regulator [Lentisphaerota bacterium]
MSIVKIAELAGVGLGTVSRYINGNGSVSKDKAERIAQAMKALNYKPRIRRPGPKTKGREGVRTGTILLLIIGHYSPQQLMKMPAYPTLFGSIQATLFNSGLALLVQHIPSGNDIPEMLDPRFCDGVIVMMTVPCQLSQYLQDQLQNLPSVWCFRQQNNPLDPLFDRIYFDNSAIGGLAVDYLQQRNHRCIGCFNTEPHHPAFQERVESFRERGLALGLDVKLYVGEDSRKLADQLMQSDTLPTGIFCCADNILLTMRMELAQRGLRVDELDMVGCNNEAQFLDLISPRPASIDPGFEKIGELTVQRLLERINGTATDVPREVIIQPQLIPGETGNSL